MNLEAVAVHIRPRNSWEAIDIGFLLARRWFRRLWLIWIVAALPVLSGLTACSGLLPGHASRWAVLFFWLVKPCLEPFLLIWISRALFGDQLTIRELLSAVKETLTRRRCLGILLLRFNPFHIFTLPVMLLEGLDGRRRKQRQTVLRAGADVFQFLQLAGFMIEILMTLAFMGILYWFIPEELRWMDLGDFVFTPDGWLLLLAYFGSCSLAAPFIHCAKFMIYISRRVELEAWDIEIGFKRMRQRLQRSPNGGRPVLSTIIGASLLLSLTLPKMSGAAAPDPAAAQETITAILAQKEFGHKETHYYWVPKNKQDPDTTDSSWAAFWEQLLETVEDFLDQLAPLLAKYGELLLWCGVGLGVAFLLYKHARWRAWLDRLARPAGSRYRAPEIVFGLDIRPESLPADIVGRCRELLAHGRHREAMSLLYRGTLSRLVNGYGLQIDPSHTENECCRKAQAELPDGEARFLTGLTALWIRIAYGHLQPDTHMCAQMVDHWQEMYEVSR